MWTAKRALVVFVIGGVVGALLDQIHVHYHVLYYPHPWLWGQAWWVAPLFGTAALAVLAAADRWLALRSDAGRDEDVIEAAGMFVAAYWASGQWHQHPYGLTVVYALVLPLRTTRPSTIAFAFGLALAGTVFEIGLSSTGAFRYLFPDLFGVPMWLPGLYLHAAPLGLALARRLRPTQAR